MSQIGYLQCKYIAYLQSMYANLNLCLKNSQLGIGWGAWTITVRTVIICATIGVAFLITQGNHRGACGAQAASPGTHCTEVLRELLLGLQGFPRFHIMNVLQTRSYICI